MEDFKSLPVGAYECIIRKAEVYKNPNSGKDIGERYEFKFKTGRRM